MKKGSKTPRRPSPERPFPAAPSTTPAIKLPAIPSQTSASEDHPTIVPDPPPRRLQLLIAAAALYVATLVFLFYMYQSA